MGDLKNMINFLSAKLLQFQLTSKKYTQYFIVETGLF